MRVIRVDDQPEMSWKNGSGTTRELLSAPGGMVGFDWRISVATIAKPGPFSSFPGVDRTLVGLVGEGRLRVSGRIENVAPGVALRFMGDEPVTATIGDEPIRVLNIMTTRGWRQEIGTPQRMDLARRSEGDARMLAVIKAADHSDLRPGDLILDIGEHDGLDDAIVIGISLIKR